MVAPEEEWDRIPSFRRRGQSTMSSRYEDIICASSGLTMGSARDGLVQRANWSPMLMMNVPGMHFALIPGLINIQD